MFKIIKNDINSAISDFLKEVKQDKTLSPIPYILYKGIENFLKRDGKRIRPILFILGYTGYTGKRFSYKTLLKASISFELLHDFLLIHDDVIDNSDLRRGKPTLHKVFNKSFNRPLNDKLGSNLSIVAGDIIFALAVDNFLSFSEVSQKKDEALRQFSKIAAATGIGEYIDVINNFRKLKTISEKDVFRVYTMKTARYTFEGPLLVGAILAGAKKNELNKISRLGTLLGQAFQVQDDLLDIFSSKKKIGKPVLSDLLEGKKTLLVWYTYKKAKGKDKKDLETFFEKKQKTYKDLVKIKNLMKKYGTGEYCNEITSSLVDKALTTLSGLKMKKKYKEVFEEFINNSFTNI